MFLIFYLTMQLSLLSFIYVSTNIGNLLNVFVLEQIMDKSRQEEERLSGELDKKLEDALTAKQESDAKVSQLENRLQEYEKVISEVRKGVRQPTIFKIFILYLFCLIVILKVELISSNYKSIKYLV